MRHSSPAYEKDEATEYEEGQDRCGDSRTHQKNLTLSSCLDDCRVFRKLVDYLRNTMSALE